MICQGSVRDLEGSDNGSMILRSKKSAVTVVYWSYMRVLLGFTKGSVLLACMDFG